MRCPRGTLVAMLLAPTLAFAQAPSGSAPASPAPAAPAQPAPESGESAPTGPAGTAAPPASAGPDASRTSSAPDPTRARPVRAYEDAMAKRRLGSAEVMRGAELGERVAEAEGFVSQGRYDEAIAKLTELVEHPKFSYAEDSDQGRAAIYLLGHALASAGIDESARAYLRRALTQKGAWESYGPYARRSVRRLVEIALESRNYQAGLEDLKAVPPSAPPEVRAEVAYLRGRAAEAAKDTDAALAAYAEIPQTSRFWSQATYLSGLIQVERGRLREGENLFCKVADPKRQDQSAPVFADERFFAVRDLARLALGRVAHEQSRFDDARYYYYLVPRDSDRLAEALYEGATTRYEKKDYEGARELLDELARMKTHHRYEDEARVLDAYIDLALCRFPESDAKLNAFLRDYEPIRDGARRLGLNERGTRALLAAARAGTDAGAVDAAGLSVSADQLRAVAALVRVDPLYGEISRKRTVVERETGGLGAAMATLAEMQRSLATTGGVRPALLERGDPLEKERDARAALDGVRRQIDDAALAGAADAQLAPLRKELGELESRVGSSRFTPFDAPPAGSGTDLPDLLRADAAQAAQLSRELDKVRGDLGAAENALARDALRRLDLRLSRLLRRARLGRIESVLGKKRALEVELEALNAGFLPKGALDSLDAARFLKDNEEYWPFEGDDWPDEFVGTEGLK